MQLRNRKLAPSAVTAPERRRRATNPHVAPARALAPRPDQLTVPKPVPKPSGIRMYPPLASPLVGCLTDKSYVVMSSTAFTSYAVPNNQSKYLVASGVYRGQMKCAECGNRALFAYLFCDDSVRGLCYRCGPTLKYSVPASPRLAQLFHGWLSSTSQAATTQSNEFTINVADTGLVGLSKVSRAPQKSEK